MQENQNPGSITKEKYKAEMSDIVAFEKVINSLIEIRIRAGKAAAQMAGLFSPVKEKPRLSLKQRTRHEKAINRRKKRKKGGHK